MTYERRWIILAEDGRHVTVGRDTDPTDEDVARAGVGLQAQGLGGWLAVLEGHYYQSRSALTLLMVRVITPTDSATWEQAQESFLQIREGAMRAA